ncbi:MAG: 4Fe-4S ferredoxin [Anaerolineae bacterium]|nr:4Fe-4S ferredoxin [Anaerolineae bacterium]NIN94280.1 4Fe-4S ferredoxin [Anaerolineae bacterium]NIQ77348.1 4Fe-4S ferredoxin [Anaerolineae bacterium]
MPEDVYRKLAQRLDAIPHGFPGTESGVELRLLAKIFAPEEAELAAVMRITSEPAADIAQRAGVDREVAYPILKGMTRKGLILAKKGEGELLFGLMPFVVGIYEEQLPRLDEELATLFEQYYQETKGGGELMQAAPPGHLVIPVEEAVAFEPEIFPYQRASQLLEEAKAWGVRECICRVQQKLVGKGCDYPTEVCLIFARVEGAFDRSDVTRALSKEEALGILRETEEAGLVHSTANYRDGHFYICNCCTCCCGFLRSVVEFSIPTAIARSDFRAVVDVEECVGCGDCVQRCQFESLSVPADVCVVDYARCVGCGQCTTVCPSDALSLERRPEGEVALPPADRKEWMAKRARARGISISDIL